MSIEAHPVMSPASPTRSLPLADLLIPPSMLIAAAAMGIASHLHLGHSVEVAVAVGVALFCVMLLCHVLLRAADAAERAEEAAAERAIPQVDSPLPRAEPAGAAQPAAFQRAPATDSPPPLPEPRRGSDGSATARVEPAALPVGDSMTPAAWAYRPVDLQLGTIPPAPVEQQAPAPLEAVRPTSPADARSTDADRIDGILKRLAAQIQAGGAGQAAADKVADAATPAPDQPALEAMAAQHTDTALNSAVDALRSTVEAMRSTTSAQAQPVAAQPPVAPPVPSPMELRLAAIAEALAAERVDVFLAPILGLADDQARHFEVSAQLRSAAGEPLDARATASAAGGAGLLPLLDALNVRHAAGFALKLERHGRDGTVFSEVGGPSLGNEQFVSEIAGRHAQGIADRMVLSFAQAELRGLGPAQIAALEDLNRLGFRFALQGVADLDMDFEALEALGFEFVKLDAEVFLRGLQCGSTEVPASDICRYFDDVGLDVIVGGIDDEAMRGRMMGCGVVLGQGLLFGPPRPVPVPQPAGTLAA